MNAGGRGVFCRLATSVVVTAGLLVPLLGCLALGLEQGLIGFNEESVGRRYFYSLRILYGDHERPWLPQGQLVGLTHHAIQIVLTALGMSPMSFAPRVESFAVVATALPLILTGLAFWWAVGPLRSPAGVLVSGAFTLLVAFDVSTLGGYFTLMPDYYGWAFIAALIMAGWLLRIADQEDTRDVRVALLLGVFAGLCLGVKVSYAVFPVTVGALLALRALRGSRGGALAVARLAAVAVPIALVVWLLACWAYVVGDWPATLTNLDKMTTYSAGAGSIGSLSDWLAAALTSFPPNVGLVSLASPVLFLTSALLLPRRDVSLALLVGSLVAVAIAVRRFYTGTLVETNAYLCAAAIVWVALVLGPWLAERRPLAVLYRQRAIATSFGAALLLLAVLQIAVFSHTAWWALGISDRATRGLTAFLGQTGDPALFLIPDNEYRPVTLDGAIYKGGVDPQHTAWADNPLMERLVPDRWYITPGAPPAERDPDRLMTYPTLVFVVDRDDPTPNGPPAIGPLGWAEARERLDKQFGISTIGLDCPFAETMVNQKLIVGCVRRHATLADAAATSRWAASTGDLDGATLSAETGDLVYAADLHVLWRRDPDGAFTPMSGAPGQRVRIADIGEWHESERRYGGLDVVWTGGRWDLDLAALPPSNANAAIVDDPPGAPGSPWWITPDPSAVTVKLLEDEGGTFVRLRVQHATDELFLAGSAPLSGIDGSPVLVWADVRGQSGGHLVLNVTDSQRDGSTTTWHDEGAAGETWSRLAVWVPRAEAPSPSDSFAVGITGLSDGDWIDVRTFGVYVASPEARQLAGCCTPRRDRPGLRPPVRPDVTAQQPSPTDGLPLYACADCRSWTREAEGTWTGLPGIEGQNLVFGNLGAWVASARRYAGLPAVYRAGHWDVDTSSMVPVNIDPNLKTLTEGDSTGWLLNTQDVEVTRLQDAGGPFVRVKATRALEQVVVATRQLPLLDGVPISARAQLRAAPGRPAVLAVTDATPGSAPRVLVDRQNGDGTWTTLVVRGSRGIGGGVQDTLTIGVVDLQAGDSFDLRELALFAGMLP